MNSTGYVAPSFLSTEQPVSFKDVMYNNFSLKVGQILKVNYPSESESPDKTNTITYDVLVQEQIGDTKHTTVYYSCPVSDFLGGVGDFFEYTLRPNVQDLLSFKLTQGPLKDAELSKLLGSMVLILCLGGTVANPIIIGGIKNALLNKNPNYKTKIKDKKDNGHFLNFSFNGITFNINKFGELFLNFFGPTNSQGVLRGSDNDIEKGASDPSNPNSNIIGDKNASNSFLKIDKKGDITVSASNTNDSEKPNRYIKIQKDGKIIVNIDDKNTIEFKEKQIEMKLDGGAGLKISDKDGNTTTLLGNAAVKAAIADHLKILWNQFKAKCDAFDLHVHPTGMGPSGPPNPVLQCPAWDSKIESNKLKFPDG